jgi:hypothetical protein
MSTLGIIVLFGVRTALELGATTEQSVQAGRVVCFITVGQLPTVRSPIELIVPPEAVLKPRALAVEVCRCLASLL